MALAAYTPMDRSSHFHCFLADQPSYLVPERLLPDVSERLEAKPLQVDSNVWFSWDDSLPASILDSYPLPDRFLQNAGLIWIEDPLRGLQTPFWAGPWFQRQLAGLKRGQSAPRLSPHYKWILYAAGVLSHREEREQRSAEWNEVTSRLSRDFRAKGFVPISGLIHPFLVGALRRYYRRLLRTGGMTLGDTGSPRRYVAHNECVARFFHRQIASVVMAIAGVRVKPSYVYVSSYQSSAELPVHTDRVQCEYSLTLLIDQTPEPADQSPWPLYLNCPTGAVAIWQGIGDGLFYRGRQLEHYRTRLADGMSSTSIFFHYVDQDFDGPLD